MNGGIEVEKSSRVLILFYRLFQGERINKTWVAMEFDTTERSIDRDIQTIRLMLAEVHSNHQLLFDKRDSSYYLSHFEKFSLSSTEILLLLKIVLGSRSLCQEEMQGLLHSMRKLMPRYENQSLLNTIQYEYEEYVEPAHKKPLIKMLGDLNQCIEERRKIRLHYTKRTDEVVQREVMPLGVLSSEFYFYLVAFLDGEAHEYPAFFRLDRIHSFDILDERCPPRLHEKYHLGKMRQCLQFMQAGELVHITLRCTKEALEAVKDRLPNHQMSDETEGLYIIKAQVFGEGFLNWVLMQGDQVEVIAPEAIRKKLSERVKNILEMYQKGDGNNGK